VILVHGCFWHGHSCKRGSRSPKANADYWISKIGRNTARDARTRAELEALDWRVLVVWECEIKDSVALAGKLRAFLRGASAQPPGCFAAKI
jgi:DNA mismatch endonuclease (patch repair protein)